MLSPGLSPTGSLKYPTQQLGLPHTLMPACLGNEAWTCSPSHPGLPTLFCLSSLTVPRPHTRLLKSHEETSSLLCPLKHSSEQAPDRQSSTLPSPRVRYVRNVPSLSLACFSSVHCTRANVLASMVSRKETSVSPFYPQSALHDSLSWQMPTSLQGC